jgi:feruloyl-CoA synthase
MGGVTKQAFSLRTAEFDSLDAPIRSVRMGERAATVERRMDGAIVLRNARLPLPVTQTWNQRLLDWAAEDPDRILLTAPESDTRRAWTFAEAVRDARAMAACLGALPVSRDRPLAILSENSIACAAATLGAMFAGVPAAPISPSYALLATDFAKLKTVMASLNPGAIFVADGARYGAAVRASLAAGVPIISAGAPVEARHTIRIAQALSSLPDARSRAAEAAVDGGTIAKILFTSGSSGDPKPVIQSHRMLADNRQQCMLVYAFAQDEPPIMVDWLPWHHTFGGNNNFGFALWAGGTLHIDDGRPNPVGIGRTAANLKRYRPNLYITSPGGFEALIPLLRTDADLRDAFFTNLKLTQYGGALLAKHLWRELDDIAVETTGRRVLMVSGLGSTECGPTAMQSSWEQERRPEAGLPVPGVTAKLLPFEDGYELRLKGDCISPGYWKRPDLTEAAFDEEGFFITGDAVRPIDPDDFTRGLLFDGRISDNFKLTTGTWVNVSPLRLRLLAALAPVLADAVITGAQRGQVGAIGFPDMRAARAIAGLAPEVADAEIVASPALRDWIRGRLSALAASAGGSSQRIARLVLEIEPPSLDNGELTDKASASARAVLARRAAVVDELYGQPLSERVIAA